jgi:hypothetical protein
VLTRCGVPVERHHQYHNNDGRADLITQSMRILVALRTGTYSSVVGPAAVVIDCAMPLFSQDSCPIPAVSAKTSRSLRTVERDIAILPATTRGSRSTAPNKLRISSPIAPLGALARRTRVHTDRQICLDVTERSLMFFQKKTYWFRRTIVRRKASPAKGVLR